MLLGARQFFERRGAPVWTNPYITDGLVAMWDGEWNAGGGVHDPNATTWKDVIQGAELSCVAAYAGGMTFSDTTADFVAMGNGAVKTTAGAVSGLSTALASLESTIEFGVYYSGNKLFGVTPDSGASAWLGVYGLKGACSYGNNGWQLVGNTVATTGQWLSLVCTCSGGQVTLRENIGGFTSSPKNAGTTYGDSDLLSLNASSGPCRVAFIRFYSRTLTAAEIAANYAIDKARFNLP